MYDIFYKGIIVRFFKNFGFVSVLIGYELYIYGNLRCVIRFKL